MRLIAIVAAVIGLGAQVQLPGPVTAPPPADAASNDYPTIARADYIFACMAVNGQTQDALARCSCSIDVIASIVPYQKYIDAETVLRTRQVGGEKSAMFVADPMLGAMVADVRRAQAEGEIRCF